MKNLILMAKNKAERLTDAELSDEITAIESRRKLRHVIVAPLILAVLKWEQEDRKNGDKTPKA